MISVKRLNEILSSSLTDGLEGLCLVTSEGSLLTSAHISGNSNIPTLAAITSSVFGSFQQAQTDTTFHAMLLDNGIVAMAPAGKEYIIVGYGHNVTLGLLKGKLMTLSQYFAKILEQMS